MTPVAVSDTAYIIFVPVFTILAFLIGTGLAFMAMSAKQEPPSGDEPTDAEPAH